MYRLTIHPQRVTVWANNSWLACQFPQQVMGAERTHDNTRAVNYRIVCFTPQHALHHRADRLVCACAHE